MSVEFLEDFSIGINFVEIVIELEIFFYFIFGYLRASREGLAEDRYSIVAAIGFLIGAVARGFYIAFDYYIFNDIFRYIAWICLITCLILIIVSLFRGVPGLIFKDFPHKTLYAISVILYIACILIVRLLNTLVFYIVVIVAGVLILIPLIYRFNRWVNQVGGYIKKYFSIAACAIPLTFIGIGIVAIWSSLPVVEGWILKISSHLLFLTGLGLFAIAIWSLPSLTEFGWESKLYHLYVLMPGGLLAYEYSFKDTCDVDSDLLGSGLSGIVDIVKEMTGSVKRLKIIRQERRNIYLEYGKYVTVIILAEEELKILFEKISQFTQEFENLFSKVLESWDGNADIFKITDSLIKKIFPTIVQNPKNA